MNFLLIRMSSMGDVIHTFPALSDWHHQFPHGQMTWLIEPSFSFLAKLHPATNQVIEFSWRSLRKKIYHAKTWQEIANVRQTIKHGHWDLAIDCQGLLKSAWPTSWASCPIAGYDFKSIKEPIASIFYDRSYRISKQENAITRNRQLFSRVFGYELEGMPLNFGVSRSLMPRTQQKPYIVCIHGTSDPLKLWDESNWLILSQWIIASGYDIYFTSGSTQEYERSKRLAQACDPLQKYIHTPKPSTLEFMHHLISHSDAVIGVDTGLLHLANALEIPTIGIFMHSDPTKTGVIEGSLAKNLGQPGKAPSAHDVWRELQTHITCQLT
jgi:heptosyltransferase-1